MRIVRTAADEPRVEGSGAASPPTCACGQEARREAADYRAATHRYEQLMRHRLANPIAIISGMAETLCRLDLDTAVARSLLEAIRREAGDLVFVAIEPRAIEQIEQPLDPWPGGLPAPVAATAVLEGVR